MKLPTDLLLLTISILHPTTSAPLRPRSASFLSLRGLTPLTEDYSSSTSFSAPSKFFHEATFSSHYDGRFASTELPTNTRQFHLRLMLKAYMDAMERIGVRTWLMHGCLLGWWWNGRIMPWDTDVDVMVDERSIAELGGWWNMTVHHFAARDLGLEEDTEVEMEKRLQGRDDQDAELSSKMLREQVARDGKKYLLEVNPHYANTSTTDRENVIDARWIDVATGLFIDITTIHVQPVSNPTAASAFHAADDDDEEELELYTKDQHAYSYTQMFPLRTSSFENITVRIPYDYEELLLDEYGPKAITQRWYRGYEFDAEKHEWVIAVDGDGHEEKQKPLHKEDEREVYRTRTGRRAAAGRAYAKADEDM